ncbi:MAG: alkaline phosphatase family protein [Thermoplasmata archaeon]
MPAYRGRCLANIPSSVVRALEGDAENMLPPLDPSLDPFEGRAAEGPVVVLLVDGLGWEALRAAADEEPGGPLARWSERASPITTVYPTSTAPALASLSFGTAPAQSGVAGYRLHLPAFGVLADLLKSMPYGVGDPESLVGPAWDPRIITGATPIFRRIPGGVVVSRETFRGSGFSRMLYDGARFVGYSTLGSLAERLVDLLRAARPPPLLYAYWDELDTVAHLEGPDPETVRAELDRVARTIARVARRVGEAARRVRLIVTGDHGMVPLDPAREVRAEEHPDLLRCLSRPIGGDRRGPLFAARRGTDGELVRSLETILPQGSRLLEVADALSAGLFGPPPWHDEVVERLGTHLALLPPGAGMSHALPGFPRSSRSLRGAHGGLDSAELLVPLIGGPLSAFADGATSV